jgi:co-chaperonin GroES (HSP10)
MSANQRILAFPGYAVLEEYELKKKSTGGFEMPPQNEGDDVPRIAKVLSVGGIPVEVEGKLREWYVDDELKEALDRYRPYKADMIVAYKKFKDHAIRIGTKEYKIVAFEDILFEIQEGEADVQHKSM